MRSSALAFWVILAITGSIAYGSWVAWRSHLAAEKAGATPAAGVAYRTAPENDVPLKDFQLVERSGREFDSKELAGHPWVGSFFFSSCPQNCWRLNQALMGLQDEITDPDLRIVSVTCDPDTDTPEVLREYANRLHADRARWLFLTGNLGYIQRVGRDVFFQTVQPTMHSYSAIVVDRQGKIRGSFDMLDKDKLAEAKAMVKTVLAESPAAAEKTTAPETTSTAKEN